VRVDDVQALAAVIDIFSAAVQSRNVTHICSFVTVTRIVVTALTRRSAVYLLLVVSFTAPPIGQAANQSKRIYTDPARFV